MGTDVKIGEGTKIVEVNHEHRTNIINETNEARTTESATGFSAFFKTLKERGYELIPHVLKKTMKLIPSLTSIPMKRMKLHSLRNM